ncbi:4-hydroxybenzoate polyprenyltransferase [Desulfurella amilsii]|uniref:4-hydroxybenzoate polyprenyltransferase n=2 Tax=Desulfurella amilsii TaxID=1562698 RepID=A0A1X4XZU2_9BACT|nr:4-hydroxybenzoate polyprenyltransferase [Desulfurella amilsii]
MIKFEHSIFALPFAYIGVLLSNNYNLKIFVLVTIAMISARSVAMALNRIIDYKTDKLNPRTQGRELPIGKVQLKEAWVFTIFSFIVFEISAYLLNPLAFKLSFVALFFLITYSYTKRFTWLCHIYLGATDAIAPLGGFVGAVGYLDINIFYLALFVAFWIGGFDILYALQDLTFDLKNGVHSIPVKFGPNLARVFAALFHLVAFIFLLLTIYMYKLNYFAYIGAFLVLCLLIIEHLLVDPKDLKKINIAFFNINSYISIVLVIVFLLGRFIND